MSTPRNLDEELRAMLANTAATREPESLFNGVLAATATVRQRPRLLVGRGTAGMPRSEGAASRTTAGLAVGLLVVALVGAAVVVGGGSDGPHPIVPAPSSTAISSPAPSGPGPASSGIVAGPVVLDSQVIPFGDRPAAVLLRDGRILIVGATSQAAIWDPSTGTFTTTGSMAGARHGPNLNLLLDGRVLVSGGEGLATAEVYDPQTGTFAPTGAMREARPECHCGVRYLVMTHESSVVMPDGRVFVSGGTSTAEIYDPGAGAFRMTPPIPCNAERGADAALKDGRVLVLCLDSGEQLGRAALYDPLTNTFTPTNPRTTSNVATATTLEDGRVLIAGDGLRVGSQHTEVFDPSSGVFREIAALVNPSAHVAVTQASRVLFIGPNPNASTGWVFDIRSESFSSLALGIVPTTAIATADGRVFLLGAAGAAILDPRSIP